MSQNFTRWLAMLKLIPARGLTTAAEVHQRLTAQGFAVSRRTVERDLEVFSQQFNLQCDARGKPKGWRWADGARPPVMPQMGLPEALALQLMWREFKDVVPEAARVALRPLLEAADARTQNVGTAVGRRWVEKVAVQPGSTPLLSANVPPATQEAINEALFLDVQIDCEYRRAYGSTYRRERLHPLGQVRTGLVSYLVACFDGYDDPRLLALHRLRAVRLRGEAVRAPAGFDLHAFVAQAPAPMGAGPRIQLRLRMDADAAAHLNDTKLSRDQCIEPDPDHPGKVLVHATVNDSPALTWWIRGFGDAAERLCSVARSTVAPSRSDVL